MSEEKDEVLTIAELVAQHVARAIAACDGNLSQAAKVLGVDRRTVYRMMKRHNIGRAPSTSAPGSL